MKEEILKLRKKGKTYKEIVNQLGCAKSTIAYHCNPEYNKSSKKRRAELKRSKIDRKVDNFRNTKGNKTFLTSEKVDDYEKIKSRIGTKICNFQRKYSKHSNKKFCTKDIIKMIEENPYCYLTGDKIDISYPSGFALDHKLPACRGGSNELDNLGICTLISNQSKSYQTIDEYIELCKKVLINFGYKISKENTSS
jgi:transcriptional regulator